MKSEVQHRRCRDFFDNLNLKFVSGRNIIKLFWGNICQFIATLNINYESYHNLFFYLTALSVQVNTAVCLYKIVFISEPITLRRIMYNRHTVLQVTREY